MKQLVLLASVVALMGCCCQSALGQWVHTGPKGGIATSFAILGSNVYVAANHGGVFRSSDTGTSWTQLNGGLPDSNVHMLAGIGSSLFASTDTSGVFRSTNEGMSWSNAVGMPHLYHATFFGVVGSDILAGTNGGGLFRSTNNGIVWTVVSGLTDTNLTSFLVCGGDLFVGTTGSGVSRSTDYGNSWVVVSQGLNNQPVFSLASRGSVLYAQANSGVFSSSNLGRNWIKDTTTADQNLFPWPYHWPYLGARPSKSVFATINFGSIILAEASEGVYRSKDSGITWNLSNQGMDLFGLSLIKDVILLSKIGTSILVGTSDSLLYRTTDNGVHWDQYMAIAKNKVNTCMSVGNSVFVGTDTGGILRSTNDGATWIVLEGMTNSYSVRSIVQVGTTILALTATGGIFRSTDYGDTWISITSTVADDFEQIVSNGTDAFARNNFGSEEIFRTTDSGTHWTNMNFDLRSEPEQGLAANHKYLFASRQGTIFRSSVDSAIWTYLNSYSDGLFDISDSDLFTTHFGLYRSTDNGNHWDSAGLARYQINALCRANGYLFAGAPDGVWRRPLSDFPVGPPALVSSITYHSSEVVCYPNPTDGLVTIQPDGIRLEHVTITNVLGQSLIQVSNQDANSLTLDLSHLSAGTYLAKIRFANTTTVQRIVKQ